MCDHHDCEAVIMPGQHDTAANRGWALSPSHKALPVVPPLAGTVAKIRPTVPTSYGYQGDVVQTSDLSASAAHPIDSNIKPTYGLFMRVKTWKVLDYGLVPESAPSHEYTCVVCGREAFLPMKGRPLAQIQQGIVFDNDEDGALPTVIQCRKCRCIFESEPRNVR